MEGLVRHQVQSREEVAQGVLRGEGNDNAQDAEPREEEGNVEAQALESDDEPDDHDD